MERIVLYNKGSLSGTSGVSTCAMSHMEAREMKQWLSLLCVMAMAISLAACGPANGRGSGSPAPSASTVSEQESEMSGVSGETEPPVAEPAEGAHILVAYFSWADNAILADTVFLGYPNWWYGVPMALLSFLEQNDLSEKDELGFGGDESMENRQTARQIQVQFDGGTVVYELNGSAAADSLLAQLPLTLAVEDYSTNEKIFYPPQALDTTDAPLAEGGAGTLAYYAPWGDVVLFYDRFGANASLYELGQAVSGADRIGQMSGTITVEPAE